MRRATVTWLRGSLDPTLPCCTAAARCSHGRQQTGLTVQTTGSLEATLSLSDASYLAAWIRLQLALPGCQWPLTRANSSRHDVPKKHAECVERGCVFFVRQSGVSVGQHDDVAAEHHCVSRTGLAADIRQCARDKIRFARLLQIALEQGTKRRPQRRWVTREQRVADVGLGEELP